MKESFYFPHYYGARNDDKILELRARFNGVEGYGIFWMLLETMAENSDGCINADLIGGLSIGYGVAIVKLEEILLFCVNVGLFVREGNLIFSEKMREHKKERKALSDAGKKGAQKRWKNSPPNSPPNATPIARKERKGKEKKDIISKEIIKDEIISNVFLSKEEVIKAQEKFGANYQRGIEKLSNYKNSSGKKYKSDYHALIGWVFDGIVTSKVPKNALTGPKKYSLPTSPGI